MKAPEQQPQKVASSSQQKWAKLLGGVILDREGGVPIHLQIQNSLRRIIGSFFESGERVPTEEELSKVLQVSRVTVRRALADLAASGLIARKRAIGTVVAKSEAPEGLANLAIIVPDFPSFTISSFVSAFTDHARQFGTKVRIVSLHKGEDWDFCRKQIDFVPSDGGLVFVANAQSTTLDLHRIVTSQGYRSVCVSPFILDYPGHLISVSNASCVRKGLEYLVKNGHRKILFLVAEPEELDDVRERVRYFEEISRQMGLTEAQVLHCGLHLWENVAEAAAHAASTIWSMEDRPTAVFALSDEAAMGVLLGLVRLGAKVPEDFSILSYDGTPLTRIAQPSFSTLVTPMNEVAQKAFFLLSSDPAEPQHLTVDPSIREAASVRSLKDEGEAVPELKSLTTAVSPVPRLKTKAVTPSGF